MIKYAFDKVVWKTYGVWAFGIGIAFFSIYPTCNWLTAQYLHPLALYIEPELEIPFVPEFVWLYFSMYLLFMAPPFFLCVQRLRSLGRQLVNGTVFSGMIFVVFPTELGFGRLVPADPFYGSLFAKIFSIDLPHNMVPSLHVVFSALILLALIDASNKTMFKIVWWSWLTLICISTLLVHQHHILDVIVGLAMAFFCRYLVCKGGKYG